MRERRRRFVYTTKNREYHVFDETCVAVRDRASGRWVDDHRALAQRLRGGVRVFPNGAAVPTLEPPELGAPMYFSLGEDARDVVTSRLEEVGRPEIDDLDRYPLALNG